ncbi:T9SS type A sorting domain-containing protein [bacterium]|nr:MAG: T9SS type A sorting domain-containing protein [bacterium]
MKKIIILILIINTCLIYSKAFEEVAKQIGLGDHVAIDTREMSGGVVVFDFNNDGWEDIFVVGGLNNYSALFQNMKDGTFMNVYQSSGIKIPIHEQTVGAAAADLDNDGDEDLIITTNERANTYVFENKDGKFRNVAQIAGIEGHLWNTAVSFIDYDLDGDLDIYLSSYVGSNGGCDRNLFYENLGELKFKEIGQELGVADIGCSLASTFSDYDNDGDFDLLVANDFGQTVSSNRIFENMYPEKKFVDVSESTGFNDKIFGMGIEGGDFDEDGDMDYYTTNIGANKFYVNDGHKHLEEKGVEYGLDNKYKKGTDSLATSWGIAWFDYDNDSHLDLFVSNGNVVLTDSLMSFADPNLLFKNNGHGGFTEVGAEEGIADIKKGRGIGLIDYDNDGDMDIVQCVVTSKQNTQSETADDRVNFFKNNSSENGNHWIQFHLRGTTDNRNAIGSKIAIFFNGRKLIAETPSGGSSYMSQRTGIIHFGLGDATQIDRVEVTFPNGEKVVKNDLTANKRYNIIQTYRTSINEDVCYGETYNNKYKVFKDTVVVEKYKSIEDVDSLVTVHINVLDEIKSNTNLEMCYGKEFAGLTWTDNGQIKQVYRADNGCDSTVTYNITVLPPAESIIDTNICYGGIFENIRITKDRTIKIPVVNPDGCDSLLIYQVKVNDGPKFATNIEICQNEMYDDVKITNDTTFYDSYKTNSGCDSVYEQHIIMLPYGVRDTNINIYSDQMYEGKYYSSDTTLYKNLGIKAGNGCDSVLAVNINVTMSSVSFDQNNEIDLKLYPNPSDNYIDISYFEQTPNYVSIDLYNSLGQKVANIYDGLSKKGENKITWKFDNKGISSGIYLIVITDNEKYMTKKFIIK